MSLRDMSVRRSIERVVYRDDAGRKRVAIVMPDGTVRANKTMTRDELAKRAIEKATGDVVTVTQFTRYDPEWHCDRLVYERHEIQRSEAPPSDLARDLTAKAASWLAKAIAKGMSAEEAGEYSIEFSRQIGEAVAKRVAETMPEVFDVVKGRANVGEDEEQENGGDFKAPEPAGPEGDPIDPGADPELAGTPRKKVADPDDPNPRLPHLDAARGKKLAEQMSPVVIESGPSKRKSALVEILRSEGYVSIGLDDQSIEHFVHDSWKSEAMVHPTDGFALRSGFTGGVVAGITTEDLILAMEEQ